MEENQNNNQNRCITQSQAIIVAALIGAIGLLASIYFENYLNEDSIQDSDKAINGNNSIVNGDTNTTHQSFYLKTDTFIPVIQNNNETNGNENISTQNIKIQ